MIINKIVSKLGIIKTSALVLPFILFPSLAQAEYYFVYPAPAPCVSCHVVRHVVRHCKRHVKRVRHVKRIYHPPCYRRCGTVSVRYVTPVIPVSDFAGYYPSSCYNNECYRYNPDFTTGDDEVVTYPDMDSQY